MFSGKAHDGSRVKTAYNCEGDDMEISCSGMDETIRVIRANYGRFSIAICNRHGYTDWSVNCHGSKTTEIIMDR
jgi:latrophilin 1